MNQERLEVSQNEILDLTSLELGLGESSIVSELLAEAINSMHCSVALSDCRMPDSPLIYVNPAFEQMTGYSSKEALGRNCRFLQGPATKPSSAALLGEAVTSGKPVKTRILNYRKDGSTFWNEVSLSPIFDVHGNLAYMSAIQMDVTEQVLAQKDIEAAYSDEQKALQGALNLGDELADAKERIQRLEHLVEMWKIKATEH